MIELKEFQKFKHLEAAFTIDLRQNEELDVRLDKATVVMQALHHLENGKSAIKNASVPNEIFMRRCNAYVTLQRKYQNELYKLKTWFYIYDIPKNAIFKLLFLGISENLVIRAPYHCLINMKVSDVVNK